MEEEYTGYNDTLNRPIHMKSIVRSDQGKVCMVGYDLDLGYVLIDLFDKTVEQLTPYHCAHIFVVSDDIERAALLI